MRWGLILAVLVAAIALAAILLLVARPARFLGVGASSLSDSLVYEFDGDGGQCERIEGERPDETVWRCRIDVVTAGGSGESSSAYAVLADDWGCWRAQRIGSEGPTRLAAEDSACVILLDYVHIRD